ncbi:MAG: hypothetical protein V7754_22510, partial [Halioglobus sp.]
IVKLESVIKRRINRETWPLTGDGWNGAFHLRFGVPAKNRVGKIHNHYGRTNADSDAVETQFGWTGLVYLSENPKEKSGTSVWRENETSLCYSENDTVVWLDEPEADMVYEVENIYNRLVLMDSRMLHRAENGFGLNTENARLIQTFFFDVER